MPDMGITRIANITGLDSIGVPVATACRPNARSVSVSQGKGRTLAAAKASALMEAVELHHAEHLRLPILRASFDEMRNERATVDVEGLPRSSMSAFHVHLPILWVEGTDLLAPDDGVWVPLELVHMNWSLPLPSDSGSFMLTSNGLASGNHIVEAISHGLCEVVERDATTLWRFLPECARQQSRVDRSTIDDAACLEILDKYDNAGMAVAIWDVTSDVGIPAFLCRIADRAASPLRPLPPVGGSGCHPAREVALCRALTEGAQKRLTMIAGSRDDLGRAQYTKRLDLDFVRRQVDTMHGTIAPRDFRDVASWNSDSLAGDVEWELSRLRGAGITRVVVVDLMLPKFGVAVVRVVIPGLEGMSELPGYVPGARTRRRVAEFPS